MNKLILSITIFLGLTTTAWSSSAIDLAKIKLANSLNNLENSQVLCKEAEATLSSEDIESLPLDNNEVRQSLLYLYLKHQQACLQEALGNYYIAAHTMTAFDEKFNPSDVDFNVSNRRSLIQGEISYQSLPIELRQKIDNVKAFQKPFSLESLIELYEEKN